MKIDVVGGNPSPEQVAVITAAFALVEAELAAGSAAPDDGGHTEELRMWVEASRRSAQRALLQRGPWRLSGRLGRRSRT